MSPNTAVKATPYKKQIYDACKVLKPGSHHVLVTEASKKVTKNDRLIVYHHCMNMNSSVRLIFALRASVVLMTTIFGELPEVFLKTREIGDDYGVGNTFKEATLEDSLKAQLIQMKLEFAFYKKDNLLSNDVSDLSYMIDGLLDDLNNLRINFISMLYILTKEAVKKTLKD